MNDINSLEQKNANNNVGSKSLNDIIKNSHDINVELQRHVILTNKINIWNNLAKTLFPTIKNFAMLGLSSWYFIEKVILQDVLINISKIIELPLNKTNNYPVTIIICITIILFYWISKRYK